MQPNSTRLPIHRFHRVIGQQTNKSLHRHRKGQGTCKCIWLLRNQVKPTESWYIAVHPWAVGAILNGPLATDCCPCIAVGIQRHLHNMACDATSMELRRFRTTLPVTNELPPKTTSLCRVQPELRRDLDHTPVRPADRGLPDDTSKNHQIGRELHSRQHPGQGVLPDQPFWRKRKCTKSDHQQANQQRPEDNKQNQ